MRQFGDEEYAIFCELAAGALFDIMWAVIARCPEWAKEDQETMTFMIIQDLAVRYGIVEDEQHETGETEQDPSACQ